MKTVNEFDNSFVADELYNYCTFSDALDEYPFLDNIITGVCNLDLGGNTRPLSTRVIYTLIASQPVISVPVIMEAHDCSRSHAQKICACLRIASREIKKHIERHNANFKCNGGLYTD